MGKSFKNLLLMAFLFSIAFLCPFGAGVKAEIDPAMPPEGPGIEVAERAVYISQSRGIKTYIFDDPVPIKIIWQGPEELAGSFQIISRLEGESRETLIEKKDMVRSGGRLSHTFLLDRKYADKVFNLKVRAISRYGLTGPWSSIDGNYILDMERPSIKLDREAGTEKSYEIDFLIKDENLDKDSLDLLVSAGDNRGKKLTVGYDKNLYRVSKNTYKLKLKFGEPASYTVKVRSYDLTGKVSDIFKKQFTLGNPGPVGQVIEEKVIENHIEIPSPPPQIIEERGSESREPESEESSAAQISKEESEEIESREKEEAEPIYINSLKINLSGAFKKLLAGDRINFREIGEDFIVKAYSRDPIDRDKLKFMGFRNGLALRLKPDYSFQKDEGGYTYRLTLKKEEFARPGFYDLAFRYDAGKDEMIKFTFKVKEKRGKSHLLTILISLLLFIIIIYERIKNFILF